MVLIVLLVLTVITTRYSYNLRSLTQIKCEQYWPDDVGEPKQYGDVVVEITSYSNIRTYDYRMFKITSVSKVLKIF